jgi:hypothetical protein
MGHPCENRQFYLFEALGKNDPYGIRLESLAPVDEIEAFAVGLVAAVSQHQ